MINPDVEAIIENAEMGLQKMGISAVTLPAAYQAIMSNVVAGLTITQLIRIADALEKANDIKMGINS